MICSLRAVPRVLLIFLAIPLLAQDRPTAQEVRGRQIFEQGTSPSGRSIQATISGARVEGSIVPCVNCHGADGKGKPESGVVPSNVTWEALTKPYGVSHSDGRTHPPYTELLFKRAITMGIDPAGNSLHNAMPRFELTDDDAVDLLTYIRKLGRNSDPGLTSKTVRLGVLLPSFSTNTGALMKRALLDCFNRVNESGGIFGRRIESIFLEIPSDPAQRTPAVLDFIRNQQIFALVGADLTGSESEVASVMAETRTPAIVARAPFPETSSSSNRYVFYLDGGFEEEASALVDLSKKEFHGRDLRKVAIASQEEISRKAAKWLESRFTLAGAGELVVTESIKLPIQADLVFWLRSDLRMPHIVNDRHAEALVLVPGSLAEGDRELWDRAAASAEVMVEAMTRAGRGLTRAALLEALEGFYNVRTNLPEPVSFGPARHVGTRHVRIMKLDSPSGKLIPVENNSQQQPESRHE